MLNWLFATIVFIVIWFVQFNYIINTVNAYPNPTKFQKYFVEFIVLLSLICFIIAIFCGSMFMLFLAQKVIAMIV